MTGENINHKQQLNTMNKPNPFEIVGNYLAACRPPTEANTAQVSAVIQAWNEIAQQFNKPAPAAEKPADA